MGPYLLFPAIHLIFCNIFPVFVTDFLDFPLFRYTQSFPHHSSAWTIPKVLVWRSICIFSKHLKGVARIFRFASLSVWPPFAKMLFFFSTVSPAA